MARRGDGVEAPRYAEVWGDTVTFRDLGWAVAIGAAGGLSCFGAAGWALKQLSLGAAVARTDAMLFGLLGCVGAGALCARLFPPKRVLGKAEGGDAAREEALDRIEADPRGMGRLSELPEAVRVELEQLGLSDAFARRETGRGAGREASGGAA